MWIKAECKMKSEHRAPELKERTFLFAQRIVRMYVALPKTTVAQVLGKQVLRSGTSVGANYREATRARYQAEFVAKVGDCLKEAEETAYWLALLATVNLIPETRLNPLIDETQQVIATFIASLKTARKES